MMETFPSQATRGLRALEITYGLSSNNRELIYNPDFFEPGELYSQVTNWSELQDIPYGPYLDAYCNFLDDPDLPLLVKVEKGRLFVQGDFTRLERAVQDRRLSLFGNMGIFFRFALTAQERHGIYSLHAGAIYKTESNELLLILGKTGAGKSVYLLEAIQRGYQIFSTDMTFFRVEPQGVVFFQGALMDNIWVSSLARDFPGAAQRLGLEIPHVQNLVEHKISVSMRVAKTPQTEIRNPVLSLVFPHIESGHQYSYVREISSSRIMTRLLFDNASEKIAGTFLLYEELPVTGFDSLPFARARFEAVSSLVSARCWEIKQAKIVVASPHNCLEGIDE